MLRAERYTYGTRTRVAADPLEVSGESRLTSDKAARDRIVDRPFFFRPGPNPVEIESEKTYVSFLLL